MDEKTLKRLLRAEGTEADQPGRTCPDETLLSAYVEHGISEEKREKIETHLADCEACLGQVAFLAREPTEPATSVLPGAVARARDLVALAASRWRPLVLRWGTALAGVACLVLVVVAVLRQGPVTLTPATTPVPDTATAAPAQPPTAHAAPSAAVMPPAAGRQPAAEAVVPPAAGREAPAANRALPAVPSPPTVRKSAPAMTAPTVVAPAEDVTLPRQNLEFRWQAVPGSLYYEINVVTDDGTVVWQARIDGTSARLPDGTALDAGAKYFIWVKAFLTGGETVRSAAVSFHVAGQ